MYYTDICFILHLNTTEERVVVWLDELGKGFQDYVKLKIEHVVYDFMCTYVRRMKPDTRWKKILTNDSRIITREETENDEDDGEEKTG